MATHDYVIANASGSAVRSDINNALAAIVSNNSSSSEPSTKYSYMLWADTTNGILKIRNNSNNAWVELLQLDGTLTMEDGAEATPGLAFRDDLNTGIWSSAADTFNISTGGTERLELGAATVFNESGANVDFRIEGSGESNLFYVDAGNNRIGIKENVPLANLHVREGDSSATPEGSRDTLFIENNGNSGITIGTPAANTGYIAFADPDHSSPGQILYRNSNNTMSLYTNEGERLLIGSTGDVSIVDGNLVVANGHGIDFSAVPDGSHRAGTTPSHLLNNYEEGLWTPTFNVTGVSGSSLSISDGGLYTRIGRFVMVRAYITITDIGSGGGTNAIYIGGLPFTAASGHGAANVHFWNGLATSVNFITGTVQSASTNILIRKTTAAATIMSNLTYADVANGWGIIFSAYYETA